MVTILTAGASTVAEAQDLYLQARGYLARHEDPDNIDTSIALFGKALGADSAFALAYAGLGEAYWRRYVASRYSEDAHLAIDYCGRAIELNDALAPCRVTLGITYNATGRPADAVREFKRALTLDPADVEAIIGLAASYERMGALDKAESTYVSAIELRPSYWAGYNDLGGFYYNQGRYEDAIEQYNEVIAVTPYNTTGYNNIGAMYCYLNRWSEARKAFEQSIEAKPNYVAYSNLGTVHFLRERFSDAAEMYEKALELGDGDYRVWGDLATSLHYVHGSDKAQEAYQQAIQRGEEQRTINPRDAELLCNLAGYYLAVGEEQKAHEYVTEALKRAPENLEVLFHAGHLFESSGDRERALQLLDKALELGYPKAHVEEAPWLRELREDPRFEELLQKYS
jgi:tetratricopeptide (TPR) repeat protein